MAAPTMLRQASRISGKQFSSRAGTSARQLHVRPRPSTARARVVVQANLFARITRIIKSYAESIVSSAEDPEKILDQALLEMQEDLVKMRQASAQVLASQKQVEAKFKQAQTTADEWLRRAELAVSKGEDELAKEALRRRKTFQEQADTLKSQLGAQKGAVDQLIANTRTLEAKISEAKLKKDTLKARAASAKTSKQIQEMVSSVNTSNAFVAFDKMEEKVIALEAEAESIGMLAAGGELESKFKVLEGGSVEDELAALKKGMLGASSKGSGQPAALPEGRPLKDAIDFELEQLRQKARE